MESENDPSCSPSHRFCRFWWLFPLALLAFATAFLFGDYGWWNDDYFFNQRDPVTGEYSSLILTRRDPLLPPMDRINPWRPLHLTGTAAFITLNWERPWVVHLTGAAIHGLNVLALFLLLRRLKLSIHAAAAGCIVHLVHASHYEAVLWASTLVGPLGATVLLLAMACMVEMGRRANAWWGLGPPLLTVLIAGLYEQPAGCLPALAVAYFAGVLLRSPPRFASRDVIDAAWPTLLSLGVMALYVLNLKASGQPGLGTNDSTYVPVDHVHWRLLSTMKGMLDQFVFEHIWKGAPQLGLDALISYPLRAAAFGLVLVVTGVAAVLAWIRVAPATAGEARLRARPGVLAMVLGAVMFVGAVGPVAVVVDYPANSRTFYLPCLCLAMVLAGAGELLGAAVQGTMVAGVWRRLTGAALLVFALASSVMYVGTQQRYAKIHRADMDQARQLVELMPDPPADAVLLPVTNYQRVINTGQLAFDTPIVDGWRYSWSTPFRMKIAYRRPDVWGLYYRPDVGAICGISLDDMTFEWRMNIPYKGTQGEHWVPIPMDKVVPFVIDPSGKVHLVTRWRVVPKEGLPFTVDPPLTARGLERGRISPFEIEWPTPEQWPESNQGAVTQVR